MKLECGPMPNVMAAQPNIGGVLCETSVIPVLVRRRKLSPTPTARVPSSNAVNVLPVPYKPSYIFAGSCPLTEFCQLQNSLYVLLNCQRYCTAPQQQAPVKLWRHIYIRQVAGRPSRLAPAHILVFILLCTPDSLFCYVSAFMISAFGCQ